MIHEDVLFVRAALELAQEAHEGQQYGDKPYSFHYFAVIDVYVEAGLDDPESVAIGVTHDSFEDIEEEKRAEFIERHKDRTTPFVHDSVWAVSGFGHNRKTRVADWRAKLNDFPKAKPYKVGDRIVNLEHSRENAPGLYKMYMREDAEFFYEEIVLPCGNDYLIERYRAATGRA